MREESNTGDIFLIVVAAVARPEFLVDEHRLHVTLREIARRIGMNPITDSSVLAASNNPGLEGYLAIDTSNITISTYTAPLRLVACVHSCRMFDSRAVISCLREFYEFAGCLQRVVNECDLEVVNER